MASLTASAGSWVTVRIPSGTTAAQMSIGDEAPIPAFIENVRGRREVETNAKRRCPALRPGRYTVRVITANGTNEIQLQVV